MVPKVSVIIPNYNHARYLPQRIETVLNQTFRDIEVILMDDCSPDESRSIIAAYAARDARIKVVLNEKNSGSTFKQWNKGIGIAQGEYIWIAESDDYADENLLEVLVRALDKNPTVGLAYCDSWDVDENNTIVDDRKLFYEELDPVLWTNDFVKAGKDLANKFMFFRNIIPNASAVVLRHSVLQQVGPADETFRLNGDWVFWAKILYASNVTFISSRLNYFRRHTNNVRSTTITDGTAILEMTRVLKVMSSLGKPDPLFFEKMLDILIQIWLNSVIEYKVPVKRHLLILKNIRAVDKNFPKRFKHEFAEYMFSNKFSGLRRLLGDGFLYRVVGRRSAKTN